MTVSVFGLGKVGLALVSCLVKSGSHVIGVDIDSRIVDAVNAGTPSTNEPGVRERLASAARGQVRATLDPAEAVRGSDLSFIVVPTPSNALHGLSNRFVLSVCESIGKAIGDKAGHHTAAVVSTMFPGSSDGQVIPLLERLSLRKIGDALGYCYNPCFVAQGEIVKGLEQTDYLLVGETTRRSGDVVVEAHHAMVRAETPVERMKPIEAEISKIASNTHETMRVAFANMLLSICGEVPGADVASPMRSRIARGAASSGAPSPTAGPAGPATTRPCRRSWT